MQPKFAEGENNPGTGQSGQELNPCVSMGTVSPVLCSVADPISGCLISPPLESGFGVLVEESSS